MPVARARECIGNSLCAAAVPCCLQCMNLASKPSFLKHVRCWYVRISLVELLHAKIGNKETEISDLVAELRKNEPDNSEVNKCADMTAQQLLYYLKGNLESIKKKIRNDALQSFLEARLSWTSCGFCSLMCFSSII